MSVELVGIIVTTIISTVTLISTIRSSNKTKYIETLTTLRSKWIDKIKKDMSEFITVTIALEHEANTKHDTKKLTQLYHNFLLEFNPDDPYDSALLAVITKLYNAVVNIPNSDNHSIEKLRNDLISKMQKTTRLEWAGIKLEARKGIVSRKEKQKLIDKYLGDY